jgi:hypothetical protein
MERTTIGIMTLFALAIQPVECRDTAGQPAVAVCLDPEAVIQTGAAEGVASKIFSQMGVRLDWRHWRGCPPGALRIKLTLHTPESLMPAAMAYAHPYDGTDIRVFYDRVSDPHAFPKDVVPKILGHVLAHEIGHVLQGISRHSDTGVMKANWTPADFAAMTLEPLRFTAEDARLILEAVKRSRN